MALPAMILMVQAQRDYEEKMEILYAVLEQQSEGRESVDIVTGLLKGQRLTDAADAEQRLALYGFTQTLRTVTKDPCILTGQ